MEEIHALIKCLTSREWESFQKYITCFSTHANCPEGLKQLQLARILREATEPPQEEKCLLKIYGRKNKPRFEMLKSRLKKKALDFLLTDISCDKKQDMDEADLAIIEMKKKSAQFQQLYYSKKRDQFFYKLLDEIILLAKTYEHYSILTEHLKIKRNLISWKKGNNEFNKINKDIKKYMLFEKNFNFSEHSYYELIMLNDYNGRKNTKKILSVVKNRIKSIKKLYQQTSSPYIKYYWLFLELENYWINKRFAEARSIVIELLNLVRNNKSVYRRQRIGIVYDHLSRCEYYLGEYVSSFTRLLGKTILL